MMTAVGGGFLSNVMAAEIRRVLREDVYSPAALAGAAI
ncbi:TRIC cation channel family protein [Solirhodobacter olei]